MTHDINLFCVYVAVYSMHHALHKVAAQAFALRCCGGVCVFVCGLVCLWLVLLFVGVVVPMLEAHVSSVGAVAFLVPQLAHSILL